MQNMAQTTLPSRAGKSLGYPRFASGCPAAQASKYPDLSIRTSPGLLEDLITQKGQTHCQAMPKKQYVIQCNPQMFRNDFRSAYTYARLYPHYFCNPKLPASQQPGNSECLHVASDTDCLCLGAFLGPESNVLDPTLLYPGPVQIHAVHVVESYLQPV